MERQVVACAKGYRQAWEIIWLKVVTNQARENVILVSHVDDRCSAVLQAER